MLSRSLRFGVPVLLVAFVGTTGPVVADPPVSGGKYEGKGVKLEVAKNGSELHKLQLKFKKLKGDSCPYEYVTYNPDYVKVRPDLKIKMSNGGSFSGVDKNVFDTAAPGGKKGYMRIRGGEFRKGGDMVTFQAKTKYPAANGGVCASEYESFSARLK